MHFSEFSIKRDYGSEPRPAKFVVGGEEVAFTKVLRWVVAPRRTSRQPPRLVQRRSGNSGG